MITYFKQYHFKKKNSLISFLSVFPPYRGGIATFSDYLYNHLQDRVEIKAYNFTNLYPRLLFPGKSQFLDQTEAKEEYATGILHSWNPLNWKHAANEIALESPEHLLISYWHPFFALAFIRLITHIRKSSPKTKISILAHNVLPHERFPFGKNLSKALLKKADHVVVLSEKSRLEAKNLSVDTRVTKLFHPVYEQDQPGSTRSELRKKYGFSDDEFVLLFFGLIRPYKGLDLMIEALNGMELEADQIRPFVVGEFYMEKKAVLAKINEGHRNFYTIIDRFISDREMAEVLTLSDAMVMPYRSATQSGILANAINFKLPTIVSDLDGLTEHIENHKSALVFPSEDVSALRQAIYSMLETDTRTTIVSHLDKIKEDLSWQAFTDRLVGKLIEENP